MKKKTMKNAKKTTTSKKNVEENVEDSSIHTKSSVFSVLKKMQTIIPFNIFTPSLAYFVLKCLLVFAVLITTLKNEKTTFGHWISFKKTKTPVLKSENNTHTSVSKTPLLKSEHNTDTENSTDTSFLIQEITKTMESQNSHQPLTKSESIILKTLTNPKYWFIILPTLTIVLAYFRRLRKKNPNKQIKSSENFDLDGINSVDIDHDEKKENDEQTEPGEDFDGLIGVDIDHDEKNGGQEQNDDDIDELLINGFDGDMSISDRYRALIFDTISNIKRLLRGFVDSKLENNFQQSIDEIQDEFKKAKSVEELKNCHTKASLLHSKMLLDFVSQI